jgi:ankyrin repeat protein
MTADLASLPPEMILHVAGFLGRLDLCVLIRASRFLYVLLEKILYKREVAKRRFVGLLRCVRGGAITAVSKFIAAGADVNAEINMSPDIEDFVGWTTPLATAVVRGQREIVKLLMENGAHVEARFPGLLSYSVLDHDWAGAVGNTPLSVAIMMGHTNIAIDLVRSMENPDTAVSTLSGIDYTALEQAVLCLRFEVARQLLKQGANPNRRRRPDQVVILHALLEHYDSCSALARVCNGDAMLFKTILTLLEYGADPFIKRPCTAHPANSQPEGCPCDLTACKVGERSPHWRVRLHFSDILHRQRCSKLACRESKHKHGTPREGISGHCEGYAGEPSKHERPLYLMGPIAVNRRAY